MHQAFYTLVLFIIPVPAPYVKYKTGVRDDEEQCTTKKL